MGSFTITEDRFTKVLQNAEAAYFNIRQLHCPYFQDVVKFNRQGFEHLRRKAGIEAASVVISSFA